MSSLIADKVYDGDEFRADIVKRGAKPVIPNKSNRIALHRFNKRAYKGRNVIERCFCRLKGFRLIASRFHGRTKTGHLTRRLSCLWIRFCCHLMHLLAAQ
jgi:transposase